MIKSILIIALIATVSMAKDLTRYHSKITKAKDVDKLKTAGLRGLVRGAKRTQDDAIPGLVQSILDDEGDDIWNFMMMEDDGTDIVLEYEIEGREGQDDEVIAVLLDGNDEVQLIANLKDERRSKKRPKGMRMSGSHEKPSSIVKWIEKAKKKSGSRNKRESKHNRDRGTSISKDVEAETGETTTTLLATSMSPTPSPTFAFLSLAPTSKVEPALSRKLTDSPTDQPTLTPATADHTNQPTLETVADSPTKLPTLKPVTDTPTKLPTQLPTMSVVAPPCPPAYDHLTKYTAGETIEQDLDIYQCQAPPHEEYCNIIELDETWNDDEKDLWSDAWLHVSSCQKLMAKDDMMDARDDADAAGGATEAPTTTEVPTTTDAPTTTVATTTTSTTTVASIACPSVYDPFKTDYIAGEQITIKCHIFQCRDEEHEIYCNAAVWDDSLLAQNDRAKDMWIQAWEQLGACVPTQWEFMEEEAANPSGAWDCLA